MAVTSRAATRRKRRTTAIAFLATSLFVGMWLVMRLPSTPPELVSRPTLPVSHVETLTNAAVVEPPTTSQRATDSPETSGPTDLATHQAVRADGEFRLRSERPRPPRVPYTHPLSRKPTPEATPRTRKPRAEDADDLSMPAKAELVKRMSRQYLQESSRKGGAGGGLFSEKPGIDIADIANPAEDVAQAPPDVATVRRQSFSASPDVQLFVIWHGAMGQAQRILLDIRTKFIVLGISYFDWPAFRLPNASAVFEDNLWRLYSGKGGWGRRGMALKVKQCGLGPFIALVVLDPKPEYRAEHTAHGTDNVNHNMNEAKNLYRSWTGGGFKVHGTFSGVEAQHDIPFLFHRDAADFLRAYRESKGAAAEGLVGKFLRWGEAGGNVRALIPKDQRGAGESAPEVIVGGGGVLTSDATSDWFVGLHKDSIQDAVVVGAKSGPADDGTTPPPGADFGRLLVRHRWLAPPRPAVPAEALPFGGPPAAAAHRREAELEQWLVVPYRTSYVTMGYGAWRDCRQLLLALRTFKLRLVTHKHRPDEEASPIANTFAACPSWPAEIDVVVQPKALWAVVATVGGKPLDGTDGVETDPPGTFAVTIAGTLFTFRYHMSSKKYQL
jgi:hypothetical protein